MTKNLSPELQAKKLILHRIFEEQMSGEKKPHGAVALRLLSSTRHDDALMTPDESIETLSQRMSGGANKILSAAYVAATMLPYPAKTDERAQKLDMLLRTGTLREGYAAFVNPLPT